MQELQGDYDADFIIEGLRNGFSLIDPDVDAKDIPKVCVENHKSARDPQLSAIVEMQIKSEIEDGNYRVSKSTPTIVSALGAIKKKHGEGVRLIHDGSLPLHQSLNSYATKDPCCYQTVSDALNCIGPGWFMAKVDLQSAYRSVGIKVNQHMLTGLQWKFAGDSNNTYLVDQKLPFGARKSPAIFNRITQAIRRMMVRRGFTSCVVMLDDFFLAAPSRLECMHAYNELIKLLRSLGFRINWKKVVDPTQDLVFLGIRINTQLGQLSLDPNKTKELIATLDATLLKTRLSKTQLQSLGGKLCWAAHVTPWGRSFLCGLFQAISALKQRDHKRLIGGLKGDLRWWRTMLSSGTNSRLIWDVRPTTQLYTDASSNGGGAFLHGAWLYKNWQLDTGLADHHINVKEFAMIVLAFKHWAPGMAHTRVIIHTDNTCAMAFINRQRAPNGQVAKLLKHLAFIALQYDISMEACYIPGRDNDIADAISRLDEPGQIARFMSLLLQYHGPVSSPPYHWLPNHMSFKAMHALSPQMTKWRSIVLSWIQR